MVCTAPVPVTDLVRTWLPLVKVIETALPFSAVTLTDPSDVMRSLAEEPESLANTSVGATGPAVSSVKLLVAAELLSPPDLATALTETEPSPSVTRSAEDSTTATAEPVPLTVLVTVCEPLVKVTSTVVPEAALTVTTPAVCVASPAFAPLLTPVPRANTGAAGGVAGAEPPPPPAAAASPPAAPRPSRTSRSEELCECSRGAPPSAGAAAPAA